MSDRSERVLAPPAARAYYDRFGKKQDSQGFYEDPALAEVVANAGFQEAGKVFELGCGTGKFAAHLLDKHLSSSARYLGSDISPVMVDLAKHRLEPYGERAQVVLSEGAIRFSIPDRSVDRVVATYVLDLLSEADIGRFFAESRRVLMPGGKVCISSLTRGVSIPTRMVSSLWSGVFKLNPALVGGCRPLDLETFLNHEDWELVHRKVVTPCAVPSEVLVLKTKAE